MAEITQAQIEDKITSIDAKIATITDALAGGTAAAQYTDYQIGQLRVNGKQQIESLLEARKVYQDLLERFPKEISDVVSYDVDVTGDDQSEFVGDE